MSTAAHPFILCSDCGTILIEVDGTWKHAFMSASGKTLSGLGSKHLASPRKKDLVALRKWRASQ